MMMIALIMSTYIHNLNLCLVLFRVLSTQGGFDPDSARNPPIVLSYDALITMVRLCINTYCLE